jgi:hypothetical protein
MIMNEGGGGMWCKRKGLPHSLKFYSDVNGGTEESHDIRIGIARIRTSDIPMQVGRRIAAL